MTREIHLERLVGRRVLTMSGATAGRIEEICVKRDGDRWVIEEFQLGPYALLERLSPRSIGPALRRALLPRKLQGGYLVPWDQLDLRDVMKPRLRCPVEALRSVD